MRNYTLLIDLTDLAVADIESYLRNLKKACPRAADYFLYHPKDLSPKAGFEQALQKATERNAEVVFLKAPLVIQESQVIALSEHLETDPLFGMASPRFHQVGTDLTWPLPRTMLPTSPTLTRRATSVLPQEWIIPEIVTGCLLIRKKIVMNAPPVIDYKTIEGVLVHFMCAVRRRSFRMVINNHISLATNASSSVLYPQIPEEDLAKFKATIFTHFTYPNSSSKSLPTTDPSNSWYEQHPCHRLEALASAAYPPSGQKRRILVDCRSMLAHFCGTTNSQLGFLAGFEKLVDRWDIHVIAQDFALETHDLANRFPLLKFSEKPTGSYAAMVHMSQPCFTGIVKDLHNHAFAIAGNMLDTIAWDMILGAPSEAEKVWNFTSRYFDVIFYNSDFSKTQFNHRFPVATSIVQRATHHSFTRNENVPSPEIIPSNGDYILIFGNNYDHKDVFPTTKLVKKLFPDIKIIALGPEAANIDNVEFLQSGKLPDSKIEELTAHAKMLIFPSWIEGFGLPIVKALAYGKPVLVRSLPLWSEIAGHCKLDGVLMEFDDEVSLKETIQGVLDRKYINVLEQGHLIQGGQPKDWEKCSQEILDGFDLFLKTATGENWIQRDHLIQFIAG